jgi:hypothetical protein
MEVAECGGIFLDVSTIALDTHSSQAPAFQSTTCAKTPVKTTLSPSGFRPRFGILLFETVR